MDASFMEGFNLFGALVAFAGFVIIGAFHPIVIKAEYWFGARCWPVFLAAGVALLALSAMFESDIASAVLGFAGCSSLWSILEVREQEKRVERGWFPRGPQGRSTKEAERR